MIIFKAIKSISANHSVLTTKILGLSAVFVFLAGAALSQDVQHTTGSPDKTLRNGSRVNPATLGMELEIPLQSYAGRAGTNLPVSLFYSSKVWDMEYGGHVIEQGNPTREYSWLTAKYGGVNGAGWTNSPGFPSVEGGPEYYNKDGQPCDTANNGCDPLIPHYVRRIRIKMPDGSMNEFRADDNQYKVGLQPELPTIYYSVDGSRMRYVDEGGGQATLYLPDGSRYLMGQDVFIDRNGNKLTYQSSSGQWTDTLGRTIPTLAAPTNGSEYTTYTIPGLVGTADLTYTFRWRSMSTILSASQTLKSIGSRNSYSSEICQGLFSNFLESIRVGPTTTGCGVFNPIVLSEIQMPGGGTYKFFYNEYGEIAKVIYPTGAYERFRYEQVDGLNILNPPYNQTNRGVRERWVSEDGTTQSELHWEYTPTQSLSNYTVTTTAPDGTTTERVSIVGRGATNKKYGFDDARTGMPQEEKFKSSSNQMLRRTLSSYLMEGPRGTGAEAHATRDARLEKQISIVFEPNEPNSALMTLTTNEYDAHPDPEYFAYLNVKRVKGYGFVAVDKTTAETANFDTLIGYFTGQNPVRITETDYLYDANYKARNIVGLASEARVMDPANPTVALSKSRIVYDETNYQEAATVTNAPGWVNPQTSVRGLPTTTRSWHDIANNQYIESHALYDQFGNVRKAWDGKGNYSEIQYTDNFTDNITRNSYALPTKTISSSNGNGTGVLFESTVKYDFNTGLPRFSIDANNQTTEIQYDAQLRPTKVIAPNGHQTITEYGLPNSSGQFTAAQRFVKSKTQIDATRWKEGYGWFDGLGRTVKSQSVDSSGDVFGDVFTETEYDKMGRAKKATNPYRTGETKFWTENFYDSLGRVTKVKTPDLAEVNTAYSLATTTGSQIGTVVTVTDQALKQRRSVTNALGQLKRVDEPNEQGQLDAGGVPAQATDYIYDVLGNLTTVTQGSQTRSFLYDSLSRLKSAQNPESGLIQYSYDNNGNLTGKTDARGVVTNYGYDNLNRVLSRSYANEPSGQTATPAVSYFYDNLPNAKGKLIKVSSAVSQTEYTSFDTMGRVLAHKQTTDNNPYTTAYSYNLSGALITETYPLGRVVRNTLDADGDLSQVESKRNAAAEFRPYADSFTYTAAGAVSSMRLGNGNWESTIFNDRLQPTQIALKTGQYGNELLKLDYTYTSSPNATDNNGNVLSQTITVPQIGANPAFVATQTYTYDSLNRLKSAAETILGQTGWQQTFLYDRYGNRNFDTSVSNSVSYNNSITSLSNCPTNVCNPSVNTANNRLNGYTFDNAGNTITNANSQTFTYDGENKQTKVTSGSTIIGEYFYDGDGKRVKKVVGAEITIFVYDAGGKMVAEYSTTVASQQDAKVSYLTTDHLGSPRITTDANGAVTSRRDFMPFGEEIARIGEEIARAGYGTDTVRQKFTSYERDNETNLDFAQARMYANKLGRFTTSDPVYITDERLVDPQQINTYAYARNNPVKFTDPLGLDIEVKGNEKDWALTQVKKDVSFGKVITFDKEGRLAISAGNGRTLDPNNKADKKVLDILGSTLKGREKELFNAIIDTKNHAVFEAITNDNTIDIGGEVSPGNNAVDRKEAEMFEEAGKKKGGLTAADVVKHEILEAYGTAKTGKSVYDGTSNANSSPHDNNPYPGLAGIKYKESSTGAVVDTKIIGGGGTYKITKTFDGKIVNNQRTGNITKVTFNPDKSGRR